MIKNLVRKLIKKKLKDFNKKISVSGDKSISIRWVLLASLANGVSKAQNLLISEDVIAAIKAIRKLGIKVIQNKKFCKIYGNGFNGFKYKKNLIINAENSGTLGRLILGFLVNTTKPIKLIGDQSLSKRDFRRVSDPLSKFGAILKLKNKKNLPLTIQGTKNLKPILGQKLAKTVSHRLRRASLNIAVKLHAIPNRKKRESFHPFTNAITNFTSSWRCNNAIFS